MTSMAFAAAPAPLYVLYQQRSGFSAFTITVIFAVYAAGVVVSLFLAGSSGAAAGAVYYRTWRGYVDGHSDGAHDRVVRLRTSRQHGSPRM
ncbi:hypothetical protein [Specibacter sp. NPDC078709]|uniref:hypothetical protein n=1 Tax=unclassified Specibacter TaxID=3081321 RepID=UPI003423D30C